MFNKLIDFNYCEVKWHKNSRYSLEYFNFLNELLNCSDIDLKGLLTNHFKIVTEPSDINLCWTHKYIKDMKSKHEGSFNTIHSTQGKTINGLYTVHEIDRIRFDRKLLYTALSRATGFDNVNICF